VGEERDRAGELSARIDGLPPRRAPHPPSVSIILASTAKARLHEGPGITWISDIS
jgi:hypothetical protein